MQEEKRFEVVECFSVGGVVGDEIAFVEKGVKLFREKVTNTGRGGLHKMLPCKMGFRTTERLNIVQTTYKIWTHSADTRTHAPFRLLSDEPFFCLTGGLTSVALCEPRDDKITRVKEHPYSENPKGVKSL